MLSYIYDYLTKVNADIAVYKKRPSRPPRMRSGWLFDEVDVTVNTEDSIFCIPLSYMYAPSFPCRN